MTWQNWGRNQQAGTVDVLTPGSVDEVAALVKDASGSGRRVKAVGSGHSFTSIAVADDQRMHLDRLADLVFEDLEPPGRDVGRGRQPHRADPLADDPLDDPPEPAVARGHERDRDPGSAGPGMWEGHQ